MDQPKRLLTPQEVDDFVAHARRSMALLEERLERLGMTPGVRAAARAAVFSPEAQRAIAAAISRYPREAVRRRTGAADVRADDPPGGMRPRARLLSGRI